MFSQLAERISFEMRFGSGNKADIFAKIKGPTSDMIEKLEDEAEADATKKAYCDKDSQKKADKTAEIEKSTARIEQQAAASAKLKFEIAALECRTRQHRGVDGYCDQDEVPRSIPSLSLRLPSSM